ncbi:hypothetical protein AB0D38_20310 [Streptomyces sp. NPDC048279]|uniref:hypothetical protein n=1 Tax=Streptomyces sp. NPDC048279 TaxID=3154714 RepID=UPI0034398675
MGNMADISTKAVIPMMSALSSFGLSELALRRLGATKDRHLAYYGDSWIDHLGWGADSAFVAARLLFSGQMAGAAAVLRSQFERWTENAAYNANVYHEKGETAASFAARAWSGCHAGYPSARRIKQETGRSRVGPTLADVEFWEDERRPLEFQGPAVLIGESYQVYPAALMEFMSDLLHGRGRFVDVIRWEASYLLQEEPEILVEAAQWLSDVLMLNLRQVRLCLATLAEEQGHKNLAPGLFSLPELTYVGQAGPANFSLYPLLPETGLSQQVVNQLHGSAYAHEQVMRGKRPAGRLYRDDEMTLLYFYERRARATRWATKFLESEKKSLGNKFNLDGLSSRNVMNVMAAEMAGIVSNWLGNTPQGNAAALCSSALRSAHWLWLEDDDRAMALLRVVLEQCARLKTWSSKTEKAEKLESSAATTPKDWLNAAGLRRMQSLNRALGEFAHFHAKIRLEGARDILVKIQREGESANAVFTARGHALDAMAALVMAESIRCVDSLSTTVAESFKMIANEVFSGEDNASLESSLEDLLQRTLRLKDAPLGDYSLSGPADAVRKRE